MQYTLMQEKVTQGGKVIAVDVPVEPDLWAYGPAANLGGHLERIRREWGDQPLDVVVPVHDDPASAMDCIEAAWGRAPSDLDLRMIVVDCASDEHTFDRLKNYRMNDAKLHKLLSMRGHAGYLSALQAGWKESSAPWVVFLSQRALLSDMWVEGVIAAMLSGSRVGMVAPWTSKRVPVFPGSGYRITGRTLWGASINKPALPMSFPSHACVAVSRKAMEAAGGFDVQRYGPGGGAEFADLYMRVKQAGYTAVRAMGAYALDTSPAHTEAADWMPEDTAGHERFKARWGVHAYNEYRAHAGKDNPVPLCSAALAVKRDKSKIAFVFPGFEVCGLTLAAINTCNALQERGIEATIAYGKMAPGNSNRMFPWRFSPVVAGSNGALVKMLRKMREDGTILVATTWITAEFVAEACQGSKGPESFYWVQDDERRFINESGKPTSDKERVEQSFGKLGRLVHNSEWVGQMLASLGHESVRVPIGVDPDLFYPQTKPGDRVRIMAHCRRTTPRRGWPFIARALNALALGGVEFELVTYDQEPHADDLQFPWRGHLGKLHPEELARHMRRAHIFFEGSEFQGWGMQAHEAMACGCALVSTDNGGVREYGHPGDDCLVVDHNDVEGAARALRKLVDDPIARAVMASKARESALRFTWNRTAAAWEELIK